MSAEAKASQGKQMVSSEIEGVIEHMIARDAMLQRLLDIQSDGEPSYNNQERIAIWMQFRESLDELYRLCYGKEYRVC